MAKKKIPKDKKLLESTNSIIVELRNDRWIYNPVVYSQISGDFSLWQQRVLIGIVERLQQRIIDSIEEQKKHKAFPDIFDVEELKGNDNLELQIPLRDLGVDAANYDKLEQAGAALIGIHMRVPTYDESGKKKVSTTYFNLFNTIEIPNVEYERNGAIVKGRRLNYLRVVMSKENLRSVFSMRQGYIRHLSQITLLAQKKRTPRLYILLSRYKGQGHKQVPYNDLLEYLGLTDEFYFDANSGTELGAKGGVSSLNGKVINPFSEWNRVKSQVLVPVQKEMKELADSGDIDIWFDFEPIYAIGKTRGTPLAINFSIYKSVLGEKRQEYDQRKNAIYSWVDKFISWCPDLSQFDLLQIADSIRDNQLKAFLDYAYKEVRPMVEKKHPDDVAAYVLTCLRNWQKQQTQLDLFSELEAKYTEQRLQQEKKEKEKSAVIPGDKRHEWDALLSRCSPEYLEWLNKATYVGTKLGYPLIEFDSREDCEGFNNFESNNKKLEKEFESLRKEIFRESWRVLKRGVKKQC